MNNSTNSRFWWAGSRIFMFIFLVAFAILWLGAPRSGPGTISVNVRTKATMKDLQVSLKHFKAEYGELPIKPDESQMARTEGTLLLALLAEKAAANPRGIKFIDLPVAQDGKFGLTGYDGSGEEASEDIALVEPWGERYYLLLESTGDNRIPNPERLPGATGKATQHAPESIPAFSAIFSSGPDKDPKTWDDNVCSWR
jgi:hypothetical protein